MLEVLLTSCSRPDEVDFMVLYTTQLYGNVLPWDFKEDTVNQVSVANFMSLVKEQRSIYGDKCIVLDNGNMLTRGLTNFYWRYIDTLSEPVTYKVQRYVGYDAIAMGQSDLRLTEPFLALHHDTVDCPPTICTNLFDRRTGETFFRPWVCIEREGIRIAVFSLVDEDADGWTPQLGHPSAYCKEMISCMRDQVMKMRHDCHPDLVLGLVSSPRELDELKLQEQIPGIDYVIGLELPERVNARLSAGMLRIHMSRNVKTDTYTKKPFSVSVDLSQYEIDPDFADFFRPEIEKMRTKYQEEFGNIPEEITTSYGIYSSHDYYRDLLNQANLWYSGADISLSNIANPNISVAPGPVNISKIYDLFNHENVLVTFQAKGHEVKKILESFYAQQYNQMSSPNDPLLAMLHDKKGHRMWNKDGQPYLNIPPSRFTSASGIYYTVDLRYAPGNRITIHSLKNGKVFHPDSTYTVTSNSYIASGFEYLPNLGWDKSEILSRMTDYSMPSVLYVVYKYFKECPSAYTPSFDQTCDFVPEDWWRQAKAREQQELNPTWR